MKKLISLLLLCSFYCVPVSVPGAGDVPAVCGKEQKTENWKKLFGNNLFDADGKKGGGCICDTGRVNFADIDFGAGL